MKCRPPTMRAHRQVGHRRIDVRHQVQPGRARPGAMHLDVGEFVGHQLGYRRCAVDVRNELQVDLRLAHLLDDRDRRTGLASVHVVQQMLVLVAHGGHRHLHAGVVEHAGERVVRHRQPRLAMLLGKAPDLAATSNRRLVVQVHLRREVDRLAFEQGRDHHAGLGVVTEAGRVGHADEFVEHLPRAIGFQRRGQSGADRVGVAFVGDDQVLAVDEAVGAARIRGRCHRHRR